MKLDRRLNIVLTVVRADGSTIYVHSSPIRRDVYEANFLLLSKALALMYEEGLAPGMCARVGLLMLRRIARKMGAETEQQLEQHLLPEIWRLTNITMPAAEGKGWTTVPLNVAIDTKALSEDDVAEVHNYLCFFTAASWVHTKTELEATIYPILEASGAQTTSLNSTEYASSLTTSMPVAATGGMETRSSIPS